MEKIRNNDLITDKGGGKVQGMGDKERCESCLGEGTVRYSVEYSDGKEGYYLSTCPKCGGTGTSGRPSS